MKLVWIRSLGALVLILVAAVAFFYFRSHWSPAPPPPEKEPATSQATEPEPEPPPPMAPTKTQPSKAKTKKALEDEFLKLLEKEEKSTKTIKIPKRRKIKKEVPRLPKLPKPVTKRAKGRQKRESLPLGVSLWNHVAVFNGPQSRRRLYTMKTGDFVRVFRKESTSKRWKIQPGVDLYLAATSKQFEAAGNRFPDQPGWVDKSNIQIFNPPQALEFTQGTVPMTLGLNASFSTFSFYERAMKNPDPVVHRVIGPRILELLSLHEDYVPAWGPLYRDLDSKIRSVTLASLKKRGLRNNREIIEDLIKRLAELTTVRVQGELEAEVLILITILKESRHPRVPPALLSFKESWTGTQNRTVVQALD